MKYIQRKTVLLGSVLGVAVGLFAGALVLGERLSPPVSGLCFWSGRDPGRGGRFPPDHGSCGAELDTGGAKGDRAGGAGRAQW